MNNKASSIYSVKSRKAGTAKQLFNRVKYQVSGKVIRGNKIGKKLGFPTANLDRRDYCRRQLKVKLGIWAGTAEIINNLNFKLGSSYKAGIVIGPLDKKRLPRIEAYLIGFQGNLYGKKLTLKLKTYLRPYRKFKKQEELKRQIRKDILIIRNLSL